MKDLTMDVLTWDRFYLSGRLQKPVCVPCSLFNFHCFPGLDDFTVDCLSLLFIQLYCLYMVLDMLF
jgi:hypothetical protein